jgi:hypothetical protein
MDDYSSNFDEHGVEYTGSDTFFPADNDTNVFFPSSTDYDTDIDISSDEGFTAPVEVLNEAKPGDPKYGWKLYSNGTSISPGGKYYLNDKIVYDPDNPNLGLGRGKSLFTDKDGNINLASLALLGVGLGSFLSDDGSFLGMGGDSESAGWSTPPKERVAIRERIQQPDRVSGEPIKGRRYFTDTQFVEASDAEGIAAAREKAKTQAAALKQEPYKEQAKAGIATIPVKWNKPEVKTTTSATQNAGLPAIPNAMEIAQQTYPAINDGGIQGDQSGIVGGLASGGKAQMRNPRYLRGDTDGMADKIRSSIDGKQPAALSHGEFVIPADVVAHLGNGNSDAGAKKLYDMMARVRKARTGTTKQGKRINPDKFMPGGLAALAAGGAVKYFNAGGNATTTNATTTSPGITPDTSSTSTLSPWAGQYVTDALSEAEAVAARPYEAYTGTLSAGPSDLQTKAFTDVENLAKAGFDPTTYSTDTFDAAQANKYMNPYLMASLNPQLQELRRQSQINQQTFGGTFGKAGGFGGGRHAIAEAENVRNLLGKQADVLGTGYATAFDKAMAQFNTEQGRAFDAARASEESRKASADYGLKTLAEMSRLGQTQRDIEADKIAADKAQFEEERGWDYKMPQYKLSLLGGLPTGSKTNSTDMSGIQGILSNVSGTASLLKLLGLID